MSYLFDHRQLAEDMALYCMNDDIGSGLPLWLPNGCLLRDKLESFIKSLERKAGYQRVSSPIFYQALASNSILSIKMVINRFHGLFTAHRSVHTRDSSRSYWSTLMDNSPHGLRQFKSP